MITPPERLQQIMEWKKANRSKWYASRTKTNEKWPGKRRVRAAVWNAVRAGRMVAAKFLPCFDCRKPAAQFDHISYRWEHRFFVQAVCLSCSMRRDFERGRRKRKFQKGRR